MNKIVTDCDSEAHTSQIIGNNERDQRITKLAGSDQGDMDMTRL